MTDPVLDFPLPDVEALVWSAIQSLPGRHTSWTYAVNPSGDALREWLMVVSLQVDVRSSPKAQALADMDEVRRAVLALPYSEWDGGVVARVDRTEGPTWLPDEDGRPRYFCRFDVFVHPRPDGRITA